LYHVRVSSNSDSIGLSHSQSVSQHRRCWLLQVTPDVVKRRKSCTAQKPPLVTFIKGSADRTRGGSVRARLVGGKGSAAACDRLHASPAPIRAGKVGTHRPRRQTHAARGLGPCDSTANTKCGPYFSRCCCSPSLSSLRRIHLLPTAAAFLSSRSSRRIVHGTQEARMNPWWSLPHAPPTLRWDDAASESGARCALPSRQPRSMQVRRE